MAVFLLWSRGFFTNQLNGSLLQATAVLLVIIGIAAVLYGSLLHLMKLSELTSVTNKIYEKFR